MKNPPKTTSKSRFTWASAVLLAMAVGLGTSVAVAETLVSLPAGTYELSQVVTQAGTSGDWIRYKPAVAGTVVIIGGSNIESSYVILDGFLIDARLDPDMTDPERAFPRGQGITVLADHVLIENTEIVGNNDVHNGYDTSNQASCKEFDFGIAGRGLGVSADDVTVRNIVLYGFREAGTVVTGSLTIEQSLFRNNFNGIGHEGISLIIRDSVFWDTPNHQFSIKTLLAGSLFQLENSLLVNSQDTIKAGANWDGADRLIVRHNTFWSPASDPCGEYAGIQSNLVRDEVVIRDNIIVNMRNALILSTVATVGIYDSDYNLLYQHDPLTNPPSSGGEYPDEFRWDDVKTKLETWQAVTCAAGRCLDQNTIVRQRPVFVTEHEYDVPLPTPGSAQNGWGWATPSSVAEAKSWMTLVAGSPGKGAASDGSDIGFIPGSLPGGGCGNGVVDAGELCDPGPPEQLDGNTCQSVPGGYTGGTLHCNSTCSNWNVSECSAGGGDTDPPATPSNLRRTDTEPPTP